MENKENDNGKRKANKIKNKRSLPGAVTYKTKYCSSWEPDCPVKAVKDDICALQTLHQGPADVKLSCRD